MGLGEKLQWFGRLALLVFVLASVAFLSAITAMRFAIQGRDVRMPELTGKKLGDAQTELGRLGLGIKVDDRVYSAQPLDAVVRQSPPAGMRVKVGQRAHIVLSLGAQRVTIPDLTQKSTRAVHIELLRGGMQAGELSEVYLPNSPSDIVLQQTPAPGASDASSPHVDLLVSLGPRPAAFVMPDLLGLTLEDAQRKLADVGLKAGRIAVQAAASAAPGLVIAQTPQRGARVEAGASVDLEVGQ